MGQSRYPVLALAILGLLMVGHIANRERSSSNKSDGVRVISGRASNARLPQPTDPTIVSMQAASMTAPGDDLTMLIRTTFPAMQNVVTRCGMSHCEISASINLPSEENAPSSYEDMVSHELASTLRAHGQKLTEGIQIEEIGGDQVRLRISVSQ